MTNSLMQWHLARDNQVKLARFCQKHRVRQETQQPYAVDGKSYFTICYQFDNESHITAELQAGDTKSYSVADHFQVVDYAWGAVV